MSQEISHQRSGVVEGTRERISLSAHLKASSTRCLRHTVKSITPPPPQGYPYRFMIGQPMPDYPSLLAAPLPHSYVRALLCWKRERRNLPGVFQPRPRFCTSHCTGYVRKSFQPSSQAARDLNHRSFALCVCLIHHLINCHQVQLCGNIKCNLP